MAEDAAIVPPPARKWKIPIFVFFRDASYVFKRDDLGMEILRIAFPAALALAADPVASLIDTAFIGHLGPVEIAAVGVSIAIFNQASKVTIFPLVSITTSFVAEEDTVKRINDEQKKDNDLEKGSIKNNETKTLITGDDSNNENLEKGGSTIKDDAKDENQENELKTTTCKSIDSPNEAKTKSERRHIPSASTALALGVILGLLQTIFLIFLAKPFLGVMGVKSGSPMLEPAHKYLTIRSLGAPAVLLSLAMQGVFRGFKDTTTPLYATVAGDLTNVILDPIFIFTCRLGVSGAAIAHVISQHLICLILLVKLMKQVELLPPSFLLLARVIATICVTLAASMAARLGPNPMAAFQICLQVWMTSSLLADGLAVAGQAILACAFAEKDYQKATAAAARVLQMGFVLGLGLALFVGLGLQFGSGIFSKDKNVIHMIAIGIPVLVSIVSIGSLFVLSKTSGFVGIWLALTIYMGLRTFAGFWRMGTGTGPWHFLKGRSSPSNNI
ncbi:hypothetical protein DH2020_002808 [Rehmannia glutinosa]|uniref:Protein DETOXIFICATION n=1 Tax=Rehmannia glutinosa TaxID=99300 RepID=A0ABR0XUT1_REHGL